MIRYVYICFFLFVVTGRVHAVPSPADRARERFPNRRRRLGLFGPSKAEKAFNEAFNVFIKYHNELNDLEKNNNLSIEEKGKLYREWYVKKQALYSSGAQLPKGVIKKYQIENQAWQNKFRNEQWELSRKKLDKFSNSIDDIFYNWQNKWYPKKGIIKGDPGYLDSGNLKGGSGFTNYVRSDEFRAIRDHTSAILDHNHDSVFLNNPASRNTKIREIPHISDALKTSLNNDNSIKTINQFIEQILVHERFTVTDTNGQEIETREGKKKALETYFKKFYDGELPDSIQNKINKPEEDLLNVKETFKDDGSGMSKYARAQRALVRERAITAQYACSSRRRRLGSKQKTSV